MFRYFKRTTIVTTAILLVAGVLVILLNNASQQDFQYSTEKQIWQKFSPKQELVHYFPDESALYFSTGVKLERDEVLGIHIPLLDKVSILFSSLTFYDLKTREVAYYLDLSQFDSTEIINAKVNLYKGEYIGFIRYYSNNTDHILTPYWGESYSASVTFRSVKPGPKWQMTLKANLIQLYLELVQLVSSKQYFEEIDGVKFGAFGNSKATYLVGTISDKTTSRDVLDVFTDQCNTPSASYCSLSVYRPDGSLVEKLDMESITDQKLALHKGKLMIVRIIST
tara:strand:- start:901 stop:1743 length:843 start_codon:yes stop_codon:yes gene_type:complete